MFLSLCDEKVAKGLEGALAGKGGKAELLSAAGTADTPKGVGALVDIGGKAELPFEVDLAEAPNGVGAFVGIGGMADLTPEARLVAAPKAKGDGAFVVIGGKAELVPGAVLAPPNGAINGALPADPKADGWVKDVLVAAEPPPNAAIEVVANPKGG